MRSPCFTCKNRKKNKSECSKTCDLLEKYQKTLDVISGFSDHDVFRENKIIPFDVGKHFYS